MASTSEPNVHLSPGLQEQVPGAEAKNVQLPELGDVLSGHRIARQFGSGGFGTIFLADNLGLPGQQTVVKVMPLGQLSEREADVLRQIDHPTVVKVLAVGRTETFQYIVMEYLTGETLDSLLNRYERFGPIQTVRVGLRIADALDAVHDKGLVHRDLKPANIMLKLAKDRGKFVDWLKLIDFGLARDHGVELTVAEGTPEYVAPETLQHQPVTPSSDLYALGVILHEMLTGRRPYQASSVHVLVSHHVNSPVPHVRELAPDVSVELDELVFELMSKEPSRRPGSASDVAKRLARLERELSDGATGISKFPLQAEPSAPLPLMLNQIVATADASTQTERSIVTAEIVRHSAVRRRNRGVYFAAAPVVVIALALLGWVFSRRSSDERTAVPPRASTSAAPAATPDVLRPVVARELEPAPELELTPLPLPKVSPQVKATSVGATLKAKPTALSVVRVERTPNSRCANLEEWRQASTERAESIEVHVRQALLKAGTPPEEISSSVATLEAVRKRIRAARTADDCAETEQALTRWAEAHNL